MATATTTIEPEVARKTPTLADIAEELGVSPDRVLARPYPGTATVEDLIAVNDHEDRICELVEGTLVEKVMGYFEGCFASVLLQLLMNLP